MINMIENGVNVNVQLRDGTTPLHLSSLSGKSGIIEALIVNGANINAQDKTKETPIHVAVRRGFSKVVRTLAENHADLDITNERGMTPRELALWMSELPTEKCNYKFFFNFPIMEMQNKNLIFSSIITNKFAQIMSICGLLQFYKTQRKGKKKERKKIEIQTKITNA